MVRIHSRCHTGETFGDLECDCGEQRDLALERLQEEGHGVFVYLMQEGKGIGLANKSRVKALAHERGIDMYEACVELGFPVDARSYEPAAQILRDLGVESPIRLLTNNPNKIGQLEEYGIEAIRVPLQATPTKHNIASLRYRRSRLGHLLDLPDGI